MKAAGREAGYAWRVLSVTSLGALLTAVDTSTLSVALPVVARHFHATAGQASWILLSYMLVNTVLILAFGRLADKSVQRWHTRTERQPREQLTIARIKAFLDEALPTDEASRTFHRVSVSSELLAITQ